jgi:hypothetical protein
MFHIHVSTEAGTIGPILAYVLSEFSLTPHHAIIIIIIIIIIIK